MCSAGLSSDRAVQMSIAIVRTFVRMRELMESNRDSPPKFCCYNSGSPRCSGGQRSPRGDDTFLHYEDFNGTPSDVVEVVFHRRVQLPNSVGYGILTGDLWQSAE